MKGDSIIQIKGLVKEYGANRAVDNLNLDIYEGEVFGLLGPNGAGKTTVILSLLGLTEPTDGQILVNGLNATTEPLEVKKITSYLPDEVGFYGNYTGIENLIYTARLNNIPAHVALEEAESLIQLVGLSHAGSKKTETYSKGMIQRLGLADVLIKKPDIMILDEPTIGIDPKGITDFLELIRNLSKEKGITVLLSSHLLHQVQKICDRVGILIEGSLAALGTIDELAANLYDANISPIKVRFSPYSDKIMQSISDMDEVVSVEASGDQLIINAPKEYAPKLAEKIVGSGYALHSLETEKFGLDDIYSHYFEGRGSYE